MIIAIKKHMGHLNALTVHFQASWNGPFKTPEAQPILPFGRHEDWAITSMYLWEQSSPQQQSKLCSYFPGVGKRVVPKMRGVPRMTSLLSNDILFCWLSVSWDPKHTTHKGFHLIQTNASSATDLLQANLNESETIKT